MRSGLSLLSLDRVWPVANRQWCPGSVSGGNSSLPGVADTRLESFWLLDEERAVGSLRLVLHAGADAEHAEAEVRQLFGGVLHHLAVHLEESVGPPPCEGGAGVDAESLQARQRRST